MWEAIVASLIFAIALQAHAVSGSDVVYARGTISQLKEGMTGKFDLASGTGLLFLYDGGRLEIPYTRIGSYEHSQTAAVHLGVAPAIAVSLLKRRWQNHFLRITFKDDNNVDQVAIFEIPKTMPGVLMPMLVARSPRANCKPFNECGHMPRLNTRFPGEAGNTGGSRGAPSPPLTPPFMP